MSRKISLITMGAGNVLVLKQTLESFKGVVDEVVYGDMLLFDEDREILESYKDEYKINIQRLPFNYIFQMGFANLLNYLISNAKNDLCLYTNTSEIISIDYGINKIVTDNPDCNSFYFTNANERHRWHRLNDRRYLKWSGVIHEECCKGVVKPYHKSVYEMADVEKDMGDSKKAYIFNSVKECVYFNNYLKLVDDPFGRGATNEGWIKFVSDQYDDMKKRLVSKGGIYDSFKTGNFDLFNKTINSPEFKEEILTSSFGMNFQGSRKDIL